jgi:cell division protein FtsB
MTGVDLPLDGSPQPPTRGPRFRLPASRGRLIWLALLLLIGTLLAVQVGRQVYENYSITQRAAELRVAIAELEAGNRSLRLQLDYWNSDAAVAAEARRQNWGHSGDQLLIIPPGAEVPLPAALTPAPPPTKPRLEQWLELFFGS